MFEEIKERNYLRYVFFVLLVIFFIYAIVPWGFIFPKPIKDTEIIIQKEYINVFITPMPDGKLYFSNEYESGIRKLKRPFSWIRENVSGLQDMKITINAYNYLMFNSLHAFNPSDYKYYIIYPETLGTKFLFVMLNVYMDNVIGDDVRLWAFNKTAFIIEYDGRLFNSKDYPEEIRFKELEYTYNLNDNSIIEAFGQKRVYSRSSLYAPTAGEISEKENYIRGGMSNSLDGYLIFEIPIDAKPEDLIFSGNFYTFGSSSWILKT